MVSRTVVMMWRGVLVSIGLGLLPACAIHDGCTGEGDAQDMAMRADMRGDADLATADMSPRRDQDVLPDLAPEDAPADLAQGDMTLDMPRDMRADFSSLEDMSEDLGLPGDLVTVSGFEPLLAPLPFKRCPDEGSHVGISYPYQERGSVLLRERVSATRLVTIWNVLSGDASNGASFVQACIQDQALKGGQPFLSSQLSDGFPANSEGFGTAMALSPDGVLLAVGSPMRSEVHLYELSMDEMDYVPVKNDDGAPVVYEGLSLPDGEGRRYDEFGAAVSLSYSEREQGGTRHYTLLVGAPEESSDDGLRQPGYVHVYEGTLTDYKKRQQSQLESAKLTLPFEESGVITDPFSQRGGRLKFGASLDATGSFAGEDLTVVIGAPGAALSFECAMPPCQQAPRVNGIGGVYLALIDGSASNRELALQVALLPSESGFMPSSSFLESGNDDVGVFYGHRVELLGSLAQDRGRVEGALVIASSAPLSHGGVGEVAMHLLVATQGSIALRPYLMRQRMMASDVFGVMDLPATQHVTGNFGKSIALSGTISCYEGGCDPLHEGEVLLLVGAPEERGAGRVYALGFTVPKGTSYEEGSIVWGEARSKQDGQARTQPFSVSMLSPNPSVDNYFGQAVALSRRSFEGAARAGYRPVTFQLIPPVWQDPSP